MTCHQLTSVLVVDDDPVLCEIARTYFRDAGTSQIAVAHNGEDALEIVDRCCEPIDFILLDLQMPQMDGVQFLRQMHNRAHQGPIGIVSGEGAAILSLATDLARKHGLNVVGSIAKPLNPASLDALTSAPGMSRGSIDGHQSKAFTARELEAALHQQQIIAHYQPLIAAATGAVVGVEALARWHHPERGLVAPGLFVPLAEESGLMPLLTDQMIKAAVADIELLNRVGTDLTVSINLGAAVLDDTSFPDTVATIIDGCGHDRSRFIFEITESKLVEDAIDPMEVLARLDLMGFTLSLDDFGTQFSNAEQLTRFPFSELKIDRCFVQKAPTDARSKATIESCVLLGKRLGMRVVAEGIETDEDWDLVVDLGVDKLQGFRFAKPMPVDELVSWAGSYHLKSDRKEITAGA